MVLNWQGTEWAAALPHPFPSLACPGVYCGRPWCSSDRPPASGTAWHPLWRVALSPDSSHSFLCPRVGWVGSLSSWLVQGGSSVSKESACIAGDSASIPGSGRFTGEGIGYPLQYSGLENSMDRGAWQIIVHGIARSQTWLSDFHFLGGGPRWRLVPYPWMLWAGASLTALSRYTGCYTERNQAMGAECKLDPRAVSPTNRSMGPTRSTGQVTLLSCSQLFLEQFPHTEDCGNARAFHHHPHILRGAEPFPRVPSVSLGNILSRFQAAFRISREGSLQILQPPSASTLLFSH